MDKVRLVAEKGTCCRILSQIVPNDIRQHGSDGERRYMIGKDCHLEINDHPVFVSSCEGSVE
jgi:hypothetical protein